ncbi:MAG: hypothetical protein EHM41_20320, partial [Chloroflexi bacterium]
MRKKTVLSYLAAFIFTPLILNACVPSTPTLQPNSLAAGAATMNAALTEGAAIGTPSTIDVSTSPGSETPGTPESTDEPEPSATLTLTPTRTPTSTRQPKPTSTRALGVAFEDDFGISRGWAVFEEEDFLAGYRDDGYHIFIDIITGDSPVFSIRQQEYSDVVVETDVVNFTGPENGYYGVLCRFIDSSNYYRFTFSADGSYSIGIRKGDEFSVLASDTDTELIKEDSANRVRADCFGETLTLSLNGEKLLETRDNSFKTGFIGLVAGTPNREGLDVLFDNV